jgi:hypothetical protein
VADWTLPVVFAKEKREVTENWLLHVLTIIKVSSFYRTHNKILPLYAANVAYEL